MIISFVAGMAKNRAMGVNGHLPWDIPADMNYFRIVTKGHPIIMGSKTFESLPGGQPLPKRANIVLTRDPRKKYRGATTFTDVGQAIRFAAEQSGGEEVMIIGGGQVFAETLPLAHKIYLTVIDTEIDKADTFFPELDNIRWSRKKVGSFKKDKQNQFGGIFYVYERTNQYPVVEPKNGRNETYRKQLRSILKSGICPFCPDGETMHQEKILHKNKSWWLKENAHPLANTMYHFVLTPIRHLESLDQINQQEWADLLAMRQWLKKHYDVTGDAMYGRSGEPFITGATVAHFHFQIIIPTDLVQVNFGRYQPSK